MNKQILWVVASLLGLSGCGGGGGSATPTNPGSGTGGSGTGISYQAGVYSNEAGYQNYCAAPRSGKSPYTGQTYPDRSGSLLHEQLWVRSWNYRTYLWYRELPDINPAGYTTPEDYFDDLKTSGLSETGNAKDKFHFWEDTASYEKSTVAGVDAGYGITWAILASKPPRDVRIADTSSGSPAAAAGLQRGDVILAVDGVDVVNENSEAGVDSINAGLFPSATGQTHQLLVRRQNGQQLTVSLVSADVASQPVRNTQILSNSKGGRLGYLQFDSFIAPAQADLISAMKQFSNAGLDEVILDMRYNGGGLLALASQIGYMAAGPNIIQNRNFASMQFNDKYPTTDPITGESLSPTPFYSREIDYSAGRFTNTNLPALGLKRLYVLTSARTCSASEALINGLRGVDLEVVLIGKQTCGKPYGFYPTDNCGVTYFTVQFRTVNAKGFGDYADGLIPAAVPALNAEVKGCVVADDFSKALGDPTEGQLAGALYYSANSSCPVAVGVSSQAARTTAVSDEAGRAIQTQPNWLRNQAIYQPIQ